MIREITIKPALNGFICRVGCQTVVFESRLKMVEELNRYLEDPKRVEECYRKQSTNSWLLDEACPHEPRLNPVLREPAQTTADCGPCEPARR